MAQARRRKLVRDRTHKQRIWSDERTRADARKPDGSRLCADGCASYIGAVRDGAACMQHP
jgi:hypothetical protein